MLPRWSPLEKETAWVANFLTSVGCIGPTRKTDREELDVNTEEINLKQPAIIGKVHGSMSAKRMFQI